MKLDKLLSEFYVRNGISQNGGINSDTFEVKLFSILLSIPNPQFRKKVTIYHDIAHILHNCDTSWRGEAFIVGWEIGSGFWKRFPINIFILFAFGYSVLLHPKLVFGGFKKGINNKGIIDLELSISELMKMDLDELACITQKKQTVKMGTCKWFEFILWVFISQVVFLSPLILIFVAVFYFIKA